MKSFVLTIHINKNVTYFTNIYAHNIQEAYSLAKEYCRKCEVEIV